MAKMRRADSKTAFGQQRAELRQGSRHKAFVGQDAGEVSGRAAERAKVRRMQEDMVLRAEQAHEREVRGEEQREREAWQQRLDEPVSVVLADLVTDSVRLARTLIGFPFRMFAALRGAWRPSPA